MRAATCVACACTRGRSIRRRDEDVWVWRGRRATQHAALAPRVARPPPTARAICNYFKKKLFSTFFLDASIHSSLAQESCGAVRHRCESGLLGEAADSKLLVPRCEAASCAQHEPGGRRPGPAEGWWQKDGGAVSDNRVCDSVRSFRISVQGGSRGPYLRMMVMAVLCPL
jgi:hypothetical protein